MSVRIGVIGTGIQGQDHIRRLEEIIPESKVTVVTDLNRENANEIAVKYNARVADNAMELIHADDVDAVMIVSWAPTHAEYAIEAIKCRKYVFCEKPLATTIEDAKKIVEAEIEAGKRYVQVGFMRRYDHQYLSLKKALETEKIGAPLMLHCSHRNKTAQSHFGTETIITDMTVHELDIIRWLTGLEVVSVQEIIAKRSQHANPGAFSPQFVVVELSDGTLADIECNSFSFFGYEINCEVVCEEGVLSLPQMNCVNVKSNNHSSYYIPSIWTERFEQSYDSEIIQWVESIQKDEQSGPTAWDGYASTAAVEACLKSIQTGSKEVVSLMNKPDLYK